MDWLVTVNAKHKYWVQADSKEDAEARGYRLHCASDNWRQGERSEVTDAREIGE